MSLSRSNDPSSSSQNPVGASTMQDSDEIKYSIVVEIPAKNSYPVMTLVNYIAAFIYPYACNSLCNQCPVFNEYTISGNSTQCKNTIELRKNFVSYLIWLIFKSVDNGQLDLWNPELKRIVFPWFQGVEMVPEDSRLNKWLNTAHIIKSDFVKFCRSKRIKIIVCGDDDQTEPQIAPLKLHTFTFTNQDGTTYTKVFEDLSENHPSTQPTPDSQTVQVEPPTKNQAGKKKSPAYLQSAPADDQSTPDNSKSNKQSGDESKVPDDALKTFDALPDSGWIDIRVVADLFDCSVRTIQRRVKEGLLPKPRKIGGTNRFNVGEIRKILPV